MLLLYETTSAGFLAINNETSEYIPLSSGRTHSSEQNGKKKHQPNFFRSFLKSLLVYQVLLSAPFGRVKMLSDLFRKCDFHLGNQFGALGRKLVGAGFFQILLILTPYMGAK